MDKSEITFDSLMNDVNEFVRELDLAIALMSLSKPFYEDERIWERFDNTYEGHAFSLCQYSVDYSLVLSVCRCHDGRDDSHGLSIFFQHLKEDLIRDKLKEGIYARRVLHVKKDEAAQDTRDHMKQIDRARELHTSLKSSHQFRLVKDFRHKHIAHRGKNKAESTEKEHLYYLVEKTQEIVNLLTASILGSTEDFKGSIDIRKMYAERLCNILMTGSASKS